MNNGKDKERFDEGTQRIQIMGPKNLGDLQDMIEDSAAKVAFIEDIFVTCNTDEPFSERGATGFCHVLKNLREELDFVVRELCDKRNKGLIIEKKGGGINAKRGTP